MPAATSENSTCLMMISAPCRAVSPSPLPEAVAETETEMSVSSKRQRCDRVSFDPRTSIVYIEPLSEFTDEEKETLWYDAFEMAWFKESARNLFRNRYSSTSKRNNNRKTHDRESKERSEGHGACVADVGCVATAATTVAAYYGNENIVTDGEEEDSTRGMEVFVPARQKYNKKFVRNVLEAYHVRCTGNDEHVALLSERWSQKPLQRAISTGREDFCVAYCS